jgi:RNA polymerase sigma factor for flagellar operon FliA
MLVGELVEWLKGRSALEQAVIALYYYEGMKLADIGRVLGTSEGKISSTHKIVALEIRQFMGERLRDA